MIEEIKKTKRKRSSIWRRRQCVYCLKDAPREFEPDFNEEYLCSDECQQGLDQLRKDAPYAGQHLISPRIGYDHHGLGDGMGGVLHYDGRGDSSWSGPICRTTFEDFCSGKGFYVKTHRHRKFSIPGSIKRGETRLNESGYHLPGNNCEHFANWCIKGDFISRQVDAVVGMVASVTTIIFSFAVIQVFVIGGIVVIDSGAVIFWASELDIAARMVINMMAVAGTGALSMAIAMHWTVFREFKGMPRRELLARKAGRVVAYAIVVISTLSCLIHVSRRAMQVVTDVLTSRTPVTYADRTPWGVLKYSAAPALLTVIIGYGVYKLARYFIKEEK